MKIYLGSDHRGFKQKEQIFQWLVEKGYRVEDYGAYELDSQDDYTKYAAKVAAVVGKEQDSKGVLFCGSGVGVDIVSNKFDGVRASIGKNKDQVMAGRKDDDMNVLVIAADYTKEDEAKEMITSFLETDFDGEERHKRRLEEIKRIEENN